MKPCHSSARVLLLSLVFLVFALPADAQPSVASVRSGASFEPLVSAGSLVSIFGTGLAESTLAASSVPLPTTLEGVTVSVDGVLAPLYFVSPGQINAQMPFGITADKVDVVVTTLRGPSQAYSVALFPTAPGIFTRNADGAGTPLLFGPDFTLRETVAPGEHVILYATGLGDTNPPAATGTGGALAEPFHRVVDLPEVYIGGGQARVEFAGLAPGFVGVYQLNVVAPDTFINNSVFLISRGRQSNPTEITAALPELIRGSGVVVSEVRPVGEFRRIQLFFATPAAPPLTAVSVEVTVGQDLSPLRIEAEDNLIGLISTQVRDGALQITTSRPYAPTTAVKVSVNVPTLDRVELLGVGDFNVTGLSGDLFEAFISGVGSVVASGAVDSVDVILRGVVSASLFNLEATHARAWLLGFGSVEVNAGESLFARVHGFGTVVYTGNPSQVDAEVKGFGAIRPR